MFFKEIRNLYENFRISSPNPSNQNDEVVRETKETLNRIRKQNSDILRATQETEESSSDEEPTPENQCDNDTRETAPQSRTNRPFIPSIGLKLDDIIAAFKPLKGDGHCNIEKWLLHFDEQCCIFNLSEIQKFIFAKRVLKGVAKSFVDHESSAVTWRELRVELRKEFGQSINSVLVHQKLSQRKKKSSESNLKYLYEMLELGSQGNLDVQAILTHTINWQFK